MAVNAGGVGRLLAAIREAEVPPTRLVYVSSLAAGGPSAGATPIDEDVSPHPVSAYGRSKLAGEAELLRAPAGLSWSIVRPPIVYGPGERDLLQMFRLSRGLVIPVVGFAERWYSIVHADDLCRGILAVAGSPAAAGRTYYLANAVPVSGVGLARAVVLATGGRARPLRVPDLVAALLAAGGSLAKPFRRRPPLLTLDKYPEIVQSWVCSSARAARELRFDAQIPLDVGLQSVAHWYREAGWLR